MTVHGRTLYVPKAGNHRSVFDLAGAFRFSFG